MGSPSGLRAARRRGSAFSPMPALIACSATPGARSGTQSDAGTAECSRRSAAIRAPGDPSFTAERACAGRKQAAAVPVLVVLGPLRGDLTRALRAASVLDLGPEFGSSKCARGRGSVCHFLQALPIWRDVRSGRSGRLRERALGALHRRRRRRPARPIAGDARPRGRSRAGKSRLAQRVRERNHAAGRAADRPPRRRVSLVRHAREPAARRLRADRQVGRLVHRCSRGGRDARRPGARAAAASTYETPRRVLLARIGPDGASMPLRRPHPGVGG